MRRRSTRSPEQIWMALIALTLMSVFLAEVIGSAWAVLVIIFGVAIIKGQLIVTHFMEAPTSAPGWDRVYRTWIFLIGIVLIAGSVLAPTG